MICAAIIPYHNVVACPAVAHLHVVILRDVPEQERQEYVGFFRVKLDDELRESGKCQSEVSMRGVGGKESWCTFIYEEGLKPMTGLVWMNGLGRYG